MKRIAGRPQKNSCGTWRTNVCLTVHTIKKQKHSLRETVSMSETSQKRIHCTYLIIGSGLAGLTAALEAAKHGKVNAE